MCVGIAFCDSLNDIVKYIGSSATQDYIVQKYIGSYHLHSQRHYSTVNHLMHLFGLL